MLPSCNFCSPPSFIIVRYRLTSSFAFNTSFHTPKFIFVCRPVYLGQSEIGSRSNFYWTCKQRTYLLRTTTLFYVLLRCIYPPCVQNHVLTVYSLQAMKLKRKLSLEELLIKRAFACCTSNGLLIITLIDRKHLKCTSFKMFVCVKSTQPPLGQTNYWCADFGIVTRIFIFHFCL